MENETTSMRMSREALKTLEGEKERTMPEERYGRVSYEEFVEYLIVKNRILEGLPPLLISSEKGYKVGQNLKISIAQEMELTEQYPLASYGNMRQSLFEILIVLTGGLEGEYAGISKELKKEVSEETFEKLLKYFENAFHARTEANKINHAFIMSAQG